MPFHSPEDQVPWNSEYGTYCTTTSAAEQILFREFRALAIDSAIRSIAEQVPWNCEYGTTTAEQKRNYSILCI
jgi:hypothetical protein